MGVTPRIAFIRDGTDDAIAAAVDEAGQSLAVRAFDSVSAAREELNAPPAVFVVEHDPPRDGFEVLDCLHETERAPTVVFYARDHDAEIASRAANAGVDGYVFDEDDVETTAERLAGTIGDAIERPPETVRDRELERYRTIVEASGDPVYTLDAEGYITFANEALASLSGYDLEEIVGYHVSSLMKASHVGRGEALIRDLLESPEDTQGTFEMECSTADGETRICENHVALVPYDDEFRGTVGVLRDVTDRKRRAAALQEQRDRFSAVFETIPEPIAHLSFDGTTPLVENVNSSFSETFAVQSDDVEGRPLKGIIVPEDLVDEARAIDAATDTTNFVERTVQRQTERGVRDFLLRATRFDVRGGREAIVAYVDITEQKERQRELERQNDRLDQFASVVSHDLRNPLNVATGRLRLARDDCDSDHLGHVETALERMDGLVSTVLTLARYGKPVTDERPLGLEDEVRDSWRNVDKNGTATLSIEGDLTVVANRSRVRSLFENLFRNAVEHAGPDVSVTVSTLADGFAVEDDGPGLPDDGDDVFEAGYTTDPDGTGYGLNIVQEVVHAHGWEIRATDGREGGARFEITRVETDS